MGLISWDGEPADGLGPASRFISAVAKLSFSLACHLRHLLFQGCAFLVQAVQILKTVWPQRNVSPFDSIFIYK